MQALVRVVMEWRRRERQAGLKTAMLVSGYQGSPLGALDLELMRNGPALEELDIVFRPGVNEELAATALWGSQLATTLSGARYEGVSGMWYGKAPGLDRAADAIRHGNYIGVGPTGGIVLAVGDDPSCKSSSLPSASEATLAALQMPTLYPGSVPEVLTLGLHAFACSRAIGTWVALKMTTNVADGIATVPIADDAFSPVAPALTLDSAPYVHEPSGHILAPDSIEMERTLFEARLPAAERYAELNALNEIHGPTEGAWLGIVAAGKTYVDVRQALRDLRITEKGLECLGVRLLKLGMVFPLERGVVERFADGLDEILVIEEKQPFLEPAIRNALYVLEARPRVTGKRDVVGARAPWNGELDQDVLSELLAAALARRLGADRFEPRLEQMRAARSLAPVAGLPARAACFCSGCPHNGSTAAPEDALVGAGIGCHALVVLNPERRGTVTAMTQMGGEGAQWVGMSPFLDTPHLLQNLGDGTFHHSGSLAVRAAVAAGVNVTFKLLYNGTVAMTGGQAVEGAMDVPALTRMLEAEGVQRTIVTTEDPTRYRRARLAGNARVRRREELTNAQEELRRVPGVTVLVHDQQCALEKRRLRRRQPNRRVTRVLIDERVCEGCGDCTRTSSCLSVVPIETEFGRKTRIHQPSCNEDLSCLLGDCPSFVTIEGPAEAALESPMPPELPEPAVPTLEREFRIRMVGIGGTGIVTLNRILATAASRVGFSVTGLDQTGLSQKGGAVVSDLLLQDEPTHAAGRASAASADLYLAFDVVAAASPRFLSAASPQRSRAVVSTTVVPTAATVADPASPLPDRERALAQIARRSRGESVLIDAGTLSEQLFGDHLPANLVLLGAAWQVGALPLPREALEGAITSSAATGDRGLLAFAWGRAAVAAPEAVRSLAEPPPTWPAPAREEQALIDAAAFSGELLRLVEIRAAELRGYQNLAYASHYLEFVREVRTWEQAHLEGNEVSEAVARQLFKLMAYKDEYEVARLHLLSARAHRGPGYTVRWHLHPPLLRALGLQRKIRLQPTLALPLFWLLHKLRLLRGTPLDIFGWPKLRRLERRIVDEYRGALRAAFSRPSAKTRPDVLRELCESPEQIRGYEEIKLQAIRRWQQQVGELLAELEAAEAVAA
jgi:indolepyruvate ferredoxin oxidoreductase